MEKSEELLQFLLNNIKQEFEAKMASIYGEIRTVKNKLTERVKNIDDVIVLLDYIETIKKPDNKMDELVQSIKELNDRMNYLISNKIELLDDGF